MTPFFRVDNRLVHGQIMATWVPYLRLQRILVASDSVPESQLQMTCFRMAIPEELAFDALPLREAARWLQQKRYGRDSTMVLMESVSDAAALFDAGCPFSQLNIGNVHHAPDRERFTNAVYLGERDLAQLRAMMSRGVRVEIQSLPTETPIDLRDA